MDSPWSCSSRNLTTVSSSVRDFTTLLVGYYFTERLAEKLGSGSELNVFLKWEQLAAYAVPTLIAITCSVEPRRFERICPKVLASRFTADRAFQILGNQKIYGLWGLYTMPARASGLVVDDPPRLTPSAVEFVERHYLPLLEKSCGRGAKRICDLLTVSQSKIDVDRTHAEVVAAVAKLLQRKLNAHERDFYRRYLLLEAPTIPPLASSRNLPNC